MGHAYDVLLDDRPLVEVLRHVVGRRTDQLYAAILRLLVGPAARERRQKGMVDVDYRAATP